MREKLTTADERKMFLSEYFENQNMKINPIKDIEIEVKVLFLYIPYYVSDKFLTQLAKQEINAKTKYHTQLKVNQKEKEEKAKEMEERMQNLEKLLNNPIIHPNQEEGQEK